MEISVELSIPVTNGPIKEVKHFFDFFISGLSLSDSAYSEVEDKTTRLLAKQNEKQDLRNYENCNIMCLIQTYHWF